MNQAPLTLFRGRLDIRDARGVRVVAVAAHDGSHLHDGEHIGPDGRFAITFPADPREVWTQRGVREISFLVYRGDSPPLIARGPTGQTTWPLDQLPLDDLRLHVDLATEHPPRLTPAETHTPPVALFAAAASEARLLGHIEDKLGRIDQKLGALGGAGAQLARGARGADVQTLQTDLAKAGHESPAHERQQAIFGAGTQDALLAFQAERRLTLTGILDGATQTALANRVALTAQSAHRTDGRILLDNGAPAGKVAIRLYSRGFGGAARLLAETVTDEHGYYTLPYDPGAKAANIELRAVDPRGDEVPISSVKWSAGRYEIMNLVAPARIKPLAPEYQRLLADIGREIGRPDALADAREDDQRQDLTLLHRATGWDARLVALAAIAAKQSAETKLPPEVLYGLFRVGLPMDTDRLALVEPDTLAGALGKARDAGVVSLTDAQIAGAKASFERFARAARRALRAPLALSSAGELLDQSGLGGAEKESFEAIWLAHRGSGAELWQKAKDAGIPQHQIDGLRLQGKISYMTGNNAALTAALQREIGAPESLAALVDEDLYQDGSWAARIRALAGGDDRELEKLIPPAYTGKNAKERLAAYAADLARKVRRAFPMQVVRRMVDDDAQLGEHHGALKGPVSAFLRKATDLGFSLGQASLDAFAREHREHLFSGDMPENEVKDTLSAARRLTRLHQITPSDHALQTAYELGFGSAHEIASFPREVFLDRFGPRFRAGEADLVFRKAAQVTAVTYGFFTTAKSLDAAPPTLVTSPPDAAAKLRKAKDNLIKRYPTMESLFGSLDYCACEHCRSVLSPAAYLVDLLKLVDPEEQPWNNFLSTWQGRHEGEAYMSGWKGPGGGARAGKDKRPYDALVERRPDLPCLPLTCENTHTALPYIDVVNEILEYYVAKSGLDQGAAYDTGAATTAELLAEPQNVLAEVYDTTLKQARYPLALPFDLWIETSRRFFGHFDAPLSQVLETFRPTDELFAPAENPEAYYRADVFAEQLGICPAEYAIFTEPHPLTTWFELYGFGTGAQALTGLRSAKALSRRLGVSYQEIVNLVKTWFVNPTLDSLAPLWKIGIDAGDVLHYKAAGTSQQDIAAFEARLDGLSAKFEASGFVAKDWLGAAWQSGDFARVLVLSGPASGCDFDKTTLEHGGGAPAEALVFLRLNLFVRLWKKLGWTIEETDRALRVLVPRGSLPLTGANIGAALRTALVYLAHLVTLTSRVRVGKDGRDKLLTFWGDLPTTGPRSLYEQLFLGHSALKSDPVFDDPLGDYLSDATVLLQDHLTALQGALGLSAADVERILRDAGEGLSTAKLTLANVSLCYRHGLLAKALKLSVSDLVALKALSGMDPFAPLSAAPLGSLADDKPWSQTLAFLDVVDAVRASAFNVEDLDYLLRHRFDPVGKYRSSADAPLALVRTIAAEIQRIQADYEAPADAALIQARVVEALGVEPALSEPLITDAALLHDSTAPGARLLDVFAGVTSGVTAAFYASNDAIGAPLATTTLASADTAGKPPGANSARFEGYLEVPVTGPFRFDAAFGKKGAELELRFAHVPDPVLAAKAGNDGDEASGFVELGAGVLHRFTVEIKSLGGGDVSLSVLGEGLPKGPLSQLALYSSAAVERFRRAWVILNKTLQIAQGLGLGEREVRYLSAHAADFDDLALSLLPATEADATPAVTHALFQQLQRLAGYARLKRDLTGGADDLIGVFESARRALPAGADPDEATKAVLGDLAKRVATFTRHDEAVVGAAAAALGFTASVTTAGGSMMIQAMDFATEKGLARLWDALRVVEKLGVPADAVARWATPAPSAATARDLRDTIKARYEPDTWQRVAPSLFDPLRRRKRDALVARIMHKDGFDREEQLFEHFLIDPGMEPVVQTSRLRLAISSVQTFIQRVLLNLEPHVHPSALLDAERWQWMKRYRVWEANRKIFLFPENWLEPEWRDDKTHLFQELLGALLQGDVSNDLVEGAFFRYLTGLDTVARLEIVTTYLDAKDDVATNVLHVIGRTHGLPRSYFYRRYAQGMWTPWEPVGVEIEGDHVVAAMWRGRLHLFWVTFFPKSDVNPDAVPDGQETGGAASLGLKSLMSQTTQAVRKYAQVQLSFSEYFQGQWTPRVSSGFAPQAPIPVKSFDFGAVFIHVSKEHVGDAEGAVKVHLNCWSLGIHHAFRVVSKNSQPMIEPAEWLGWPPYNTFVSATGQAHYDVSGPLTVHFVKETETQGGDKSNGTWDMQTILHKALREGGGYSLLFPANPVSLLTTSGEDIGALVTPFFYQDEDATFYVEPSLTETTIERWDDWVVSRPPPEAKPGAFDAVVVRPLFPRPAPVKKPDPGDPASIHAIFELVEEGDWIVNDTATVAFGDRAIRGDGVSVQVASGKVAGFIMG